MNEWMNEWMNECKWTNECEWMNWWWFSLRLTSLLWAAFVLYMATAFLIKGTQFPYDCNKVSFWGMKYFKIQ